MRLLALRTAALTAALLALSDTSHAQSQGWSKVDSALGRSGALQPGDVMKYSFPRSDLDVTVNGVKLKPAFALGSWVAFKRMGGTAMVMGDLVLSETEVAPVIASLQVNGVEQTAIHNHLIGETPRVMYVHISAHGNEAKIARAIHDALGATGTPLGRPGPPSAQPSDLDSAAIAKTIGYRGKMNGTVYQIAVPRAEKVTEKGMEVPPSMGLATAINFQSTGNGNAAITGDFVMTANEVNRVIRALLANHIQPTALHSHMLGESPKLYFMHFWANDNAASLARGLAMALKEMKVRKPDK